MKMTSLKNWLYVLAGGICMSMFAVAPAAGAPLSTNAAWAWIKGTNIINQYGTYGTRGVPAPTNTPGARYTAVSWTDGTGALWLFGGFGYDFTGGLGRLNDLWKYDPATTNWTWMKGATMTNQNGTYGTQGTADSANTPGARYMAVSWTDGTGALWLFGGQGFPASGFNGYLNDLWKYDPATTNWTWIKGTNIINQNGTYGTQGVPAPANTPGARYSAVSWTDGAGALWLFGGYGYDAFGSLSYLNDLWKYDPATTNWTWIKGTNIINQNGTYGTQGVPAPANTPGARYSAVSWTDGAGALWLFGGYGYDFTGGLGRLNDLWKYDPATTNWTWIKGTNIINQNGTYGTQGVPAPANTPGARDPAVSWTDGAGALWLFGGQGYDAFGSLSYLNDLWKYDPATTNWTWMKGANITNQTGTYGTQGVPAPTNTPGARDHAVSWTDGAGALWLFGGSGYPASGGSGYLNDLWKYDDTSNPTITASAGPHGAVAPSGVVEVAYGASTSFVVTADVYYHIGSLTTNGVSVGEATNRPVYTSVWENVIATGALTAAFAENLTTNTGTPEWWLAQYGWTSNFNAAATNDADSDGTPAWAEYLAGTVPTNSSSVLAIVGIYQTNGEMRIEWKGGTNAWQILEIRKDLVSTIEQWLAICTNPPPTPVTTNYLHDATTNDVMFYRIKARRE